MALGRFHNSLSFGHEYSVSTPSLFRMSLHLCVAKQWISHHCSPPLHPLFHGCPGMTIPSLPPTPQLCPEERWRPPKPPPPSGPKQTFSAIPHAGCSTTCLEGTGMNVPNPYGQCHLSQDRRFSPGERRGCWWDPPALTISWGEDIIRGINISAGFQRRFPSCHLVDKGDIFPFLFHRRRRSTRESSFSVGNLAKHHPI